LREPSPASFEHYVPLNERPRLLVALGAATSSRRPSSA
jgi:hypothetical protein